MTTETKDVTAQDIIKLIKPVHAARKKRSDGDREDKKLSPTIKKYLRTKPEGEQEEWDMEVDPPIGVGLEPGGGRRWVHNDKLSDANILWLVRKGILGGLDAALYDAIKDLPSQEPEAFDHMTALARALESGGGETLVMLPKRGQS